MSKTTASIKETVNQFLDENEKFENGNGAAGTRARKILSELGKLIKLRRGEISTTKAERKESKEG
jgi:Histone H1-like protein Hc1